MSGPRDSAPLVPLVLALTALNAPKVHAGEARQLPQMTVEGEAVSAPEAYPVELQPTTITTPDTAALLQRAPGANVNRNGPLTGLAQYRGMYGDRVNVLVNGMNISSGGPNGMDPALSYVPRTQLQSLEVIRGIAPVSSGVETIGGTIIADSRRSQFASGKNVRPTLDLTLGGATADRSHVYSAFGSAANSSHRLHAYGSKERGGNIEFPDGKIRPTRHERLNYGAGYGFRHEGQEISFDLRRNRTDDTGTPSLPMDIVFIDTDIYESEYQGRFGDYELHGKLYYSDVDHEMSNYDLRQPATPAASRLNTTKSNSLGYRADFGLPLGPGTLLLGSDGHFDSHDATVTNPVNPAFRVQAFNGVDRNAFGFFAEWNATLANDWDLQLGARYNRVESSSGTVSHFMAGMNPMIATLQNRFNSAKRDNNQNNLDLVAKLDYHLSSRLDLIAEGGIKKRAPSYQELYLWVPLQATNGLADGHNYVGDLNLDSETAYEAGLGLDWRGRRAYAAPRLFYRYVDNYIQGTPSTDPVVIMVSTANGDPKPLQFSNVDARLYGGDMDWGVRFGRHWRLDGVLSYVRGERRDIHDDLYRIAPLNGNAMLSYNRSRWWAGIEGVGYAKQNKVSETNDEQKSDGYALLNLRAGLTLIRELEIRLGVENVLDKNYQPHLSGINRVAASDVAVGEHVPGPGRNYYATLEYHYR